MSLREADSTLAVRNACDSGSSTSSPRLTGCPPGFRAHVEAILARMVIPDAAYREHWYLVVTRSYGQLVNGQTYSVAAGSGHLRVRSADGSVALFRRWRCLLALGPGVLRDVEFSPEARCITVKPAQERPRRRRYRSTEEPISPEGNRTLRAQLAELKRRQEAGTA